MARKRFELASRVRAVSAEGGSQRWCSSPCRFALAGILYMINTEYIMILFQDPLGQTMVTVAGMLMICWGCDHQTHGDRSHLGVFRWIRGGRWPGCCSRVFSW